MPCLESGARLLLPNRLAAACVRPGSSPKNMIRNLYTSSSFQSGCSAAVPCAAALATLGTRHSGHSSGGGHCTWWARRGGLKVSNGHSPSYLMSLIPVCIISLKLHV